ncbi:MAG: hypothetical protein HOH95_10780 [Dehalococcoidia bacterium]|jgi:hypothetical protein|nr:hypothetical protein [Dehalococcoidia bacterium]
MSTASAGRAFDRSSSLVDPARPVATGNLMQAFKGLDWRELTIQLGVLTAHLWRERITPTGWGER